MLGAVIGSFLVEAWEKTGEIPTDGGLPDGIGLTAAALRLLGVAQGLRESDADPHSAGDECAYWVNELENECVHEGYEADEAGTCDLQCVQAAPAGLISVSVEDAEQLAAVICEEADEASCKSGMALAGALCMACEGTDSERITAYVLSKELPPDSPVLTGLGALLKAESFEEAVEKALEHGFGTEAALCAASLAEPVFGIPDELADSAWDILTPDLREIAESFQEFLLTQRAAI